MDWARRSLHSDTEAAVRDQPGRHRENSPPRVVSLPALGETTEAGHAVWAWTEDGGRVSGMREHPPGTGGPGCALSTSGAGVRVPADDDIHVTGPDGLHEPGVPGLGLDPRHAPGAMARTPLPLTGGCPFLQPESPTGATPGLTSMRAVQITPLRRSRGPGHRRRFRAGARTGTEALRRLHGGCELRPHPPPPVLRGTSGWQDAASRRFAICRTGLTPTRYVEVRRRFLREHPGHALDSWPLPAD
jgi:hypothetical protein